MTERGGRLGLDFEALQAIGFSGRELGENLDGDVAI